MANEDADPEAEPGTASDYPEAVVSALAVLAHQLDRSVDSLTIETYEEVLWPDACLGLADKDEMCAQVIVNGWRIDVRADDGAWELHTDATGEQVRWRPAGS